MAKQTDCPVLEPYNPLDKKHVGESIQNALLASDICPLPPKPFIGAGVYALYYLGDFLAYRDLAEANRISCTYPIYIGKAVPRGARKGGWDDKPGKDLYNRLLQHAQSIEAAINLRLEDFRCQFLSVDSIWIPLTESLMIDRFQPVWNCLIDGFGNHDPGAGRQKGSVPMWDCLHPGRKWAEGLKPSALEPENLQIRIMEYLARIKTHETGQNPV